MSISFPGTNNNHINVGSPPTLEITGAFTISAWAICNIEQNIDLVTKQTASNRGFSFQTDDDGSGNTYSKFVIAVDSTVTISSWWPSVPMTHGFMHHIAGQFVPSTAVQIWQDGILESENTTGIPATMYDPPNSFTIGGRPDGTSVFDGILEDIRVYNRNLSAAEMKTIFACRGHDGIVDGLVSRWLMNEKPNGVVASGPNSVIDIGPNSNHGSPVGTITYKSSLLNFIRQAA